MNWKAAGPRTVAGLIAAAGLILPAAGCSSPSAAGGGAAARGRAGVTSAVSFAHCMRSHGVPKYPDPSGSNTMADGLPKVSPQQLGITMARFQAAQHACGRQVPNAGQTAQSASRQLLSDGLKFARCIRSHGVPNWPDPTRSTSTQVDLGAPAYMFQMDGLQGLDGRSFPAQVRAAMHECLRLTHLSGSQVPDWSG